MRLQKVINIPHSHYQLQYQPDNNQFTPVTKFRYDGIGHRVKAEIEIPTVSEAITDWSHVTEVKTPGKSGNPDTPVYDLTYNNNGNMTERVDHLAGKTYTQEFDIENRLITVTVNSGTPITTTFAYDPTGQRTL